MTQVYTIKGMTCNGCRGSVEKKLSDVAGVDSVVVSLEEETATVDAEAVVTLKEIGAVLPEKYTVTEKVSLNTENRSAAQDSGVFKSAQTEGKEVSKWKQLKPLFLILGYITVTVLLLHYRNWSTSEAMLDFMGLFYIVFSFFKMLDIRGFAMSFQMYDPLAKRIPVYGKVYPFLETALGVMFLMRFEVTLALIVTVVLLGITTIGVSRTLLDKKEIQCACLGTALDLPMTEATFIENAIMIVMAITMIIQLL